MKPNRSLDEWDKVAKGYEDSLKLKYGKEVLKDFELLFNAVVAGIITYANDQEFIEGTLHHLNNVQDEAEHEIVEED